MDIFLGHSSALEFWRGRFSEDARLCGKASLSSCYAGSSFEELFGLSRFDITSHPIDVFVDSVDARRNTKLCTSHVISGQLPAGALCQVAAHVYVSSPELTLVHMSRVLPKPKLMQLVFEFCGTYRSAATGEVEYDRPPLTSVEKIAAFCDRYYAYPEKEALPKVLRYCADGSGSPMETVLVMVLCCPMRMGGYGLPLPVLNRRIDYPREYAYRIGANYFKCDLYWRSPALALEYDSNEHHADVGSMTEDALRRNILESMGIRMLTATWGQVKSAAATEVLAQEIAKILKHRIRSRGSDYRRRRKALRDELLPFVRGWRPSPRN